VGEFALKSCKVSVHSRLGVVAVQAWVQFCKCFAQNSRVDLQICRLNSLIFRRDRNRRGRILDTRSYAPKQNRGKRRIDKSYHLLRSRNLVVTARADTLHDVGIGGTTKASSCGKFAANIEPRLFHDDSSRVVPNRPISTVFDKACSASDPCPIDPSRQCNPDHKRVCQMRHTAARTSARVGAFRVEKVVKSAKHKNYESSGR
jgi:hypothetical protein